MSPCLKRLVQSFTWKDTYRAVYPSGSCFSHFYNSNGPGATRIDRSYCYGDIAPLDAEYVPAAFSDHLAYIVTIEAPTLLKKMVSPKFRPFFKIPPDAPQGYPP